MRATSTMILGAAIIWAILSYFAKESRINLMSSDWIYGSIFCALFLVGWGMNIQHDQLMEKINKLHERIVELENPE
ncbi:hypothetical protein N9L80_02795 [Luminiphilus sp.]|nr:hypothetical protein [Luminiphilus sp.]